MSRFGNLMVRAAVPKFNSALGNRRTGPTPGKGTVAAGTSAIQYVGDGQTMTLDMNAQEASKLAYLGNTYVMRCARLCAETIAGLPWVAGIDPTDPANYDKTTTLANLLGPATPQAPGGPNPVTSARAFWTWTIVQYLITGRWGWECQLEGNKANRNIVGLWPLVSACLNPKPTTHGEAKWFNGYQYQPATGDIDLTEEQVVYCWRPSIDDWRMPESVLQAASAPVFIARAVDRYIASLLKNGMVATTMIITPPFEESEHRRAWQDQFLTEFTGVDRAGSTIFGEVEHDESDPAGKPLVQVERLAASPADAQLQQLARDAENDICIAFGVPRSLIGDASQRTYANAASEYKNFWTLTVLGLIAEIQDHVNMSLAPRVGDEVGWFDLSRVAAVQPPAVFAPPDIVAVIETGVATAAQIANMLGIQTADATGDSDTDTVDIGEEQAGGQGGKRYLGSRELTLRAMQDPELARMLDEAGRRLNAPINTWTLRGERKPWQPLERENITPLTPVIEARAVATSGAGIDKANAIIDRVESIRALKAADKLTDEVKGTLAKHYPADVLGWVDDADWSGPKDVSLDDIQMDRRPGGRDQQKVQGIAKAQVDGQEGALAPVVLVKTPGSDKLKVADGYHRTLASKRRGKKTTKAYVGTVSEDTGPWDTQMHQKKLNRSVEVLAERGFDGWLDEVGPELEAAIGA